MSVSHVVSLRGNAGGRTRDSLDSPPMPRTPRNPPALGRFHCCSHSSPLQPTTEFPEAVNRPRRRIVSTETSPKRSRPTDGCGSVSGRADGVAAGIAAVDVVHAVRRARGAGPGAGKDLPHKAHGLFQRDGDRGLARWRRRLDEDPAQARGKRFEHGRRRRAVARQHHPRARHLHHAGPARRAKGSASFILRRTTGARWRGPQDVVFDLPGVDFYVSTDDGGRPHNAQRLHRRILELPNGDLLTTFYGWMKGDRTPPRPYNPKMMKTRVLLARSTDRGRHWKLVSTVAVDPGHRYRGFRRARASSASARNQSQAPHLSHAHRTRAVRSCVGRRRRHVDPCPSARVRRTRHLPHRTVGRHVPRREKYQREDSRAKKNPDDLRGAVVDPDLIELRSGLLVAAFGVRVPQKDCWLQPAPDMERELPRLQSRPWGDLEQRAAA